MTTTQTERPTGIRCGKCTGRHATVLEVKNCYGVELSSVQDATPISTPHYGAPARNATDKMVSFIVDMLGNREIPIELSGTTERLWAQCEAHDIDVRTPGDGTRMPFDVAKRAIELLKPLPRVRAAATEYDVPAGHYAVESLTGNNDLDFFRVDRPTEGSHKGKTFVKRVIGGRPDCNVRGKTFHQALKAIQDAGIDVAAKRYGTEIGRCYRCNRHLTDETSRALGIGPDCRNK